MTAQMHDEHFLIKELRQEMPETRSSLLLLGLLVMGFIGDLKKMGLVELILSQRALCAAILPFSELSEEEAKRLLTEYHVEILALEEIFDLEIGCS